MRTNLLVAATSLCIASFAPSPAKSAMLRPFCQVSAATVRLTDLFDDLGNTPDRLLGAAPAPGTHIVVDAPQLAAIARDFNVDWRPQTGAEQSTIERIGDILPQSKVTGQLRSALIIAGAPEDFDVLSPDTQPIILPAGATPIPEIRQLSYDTQTNRFTAMVNVEVSGLAPTQLRISGQIVPMVQAVVASHRLPSGTIVHAEDVHSARVRSAQLRTSVAISAENAIGMALRHNVPEGQALTVADLTHPSLVERGSLVRMSLDSDGLTLSAQGIAKEAGARGDHIRVENPLSHLVVLAEVLSAGEVRVAPREAAVTLVSAQ